jgi:hypothetical protein
MNTLNEIAQLEDALEKFIFYKEELKEIGRIITQLKDGNCNPDVLKSKILESRARMLKDITEFTNFYIAHIPSNNMDITLPPYIQKELEQKNALLMDIAKKLVSMTSEVKIDENTIELLNENYDSKQELNRYLRNLSIEEWLDLIETKENQINVNYYRLILWFNANLEDYHEKKHGKCQSCDMPQKIKSLELPLTLEKRLLNLNKIRNKISHYKYELTLQDQNETLTTFFMFLLYLITKDYPYNKKNCDDLKQALKTFLSKSFINVQELCDLISASVDNFFAI